MNGYKSVYNTSFNKLTTSYNDLKKINHKNYIFAIDGQNMFKQSIYNNDFKNQNGEKSKSFKPQHVYYKTQLLGSTTYNNSFRDWRMDAPPIVK